MFSKPQTTQLQDTPLQLLTIFLKVSKFSFYVVWWRVP